VSALLHTAEGVSAEIRRRLLTCTVAQGAETDLGRVVHHGQATIDVEQAPCCKLVEGDDVATRAGLKPDYEIEQRFAVIAYIPCTRDAPMTAAHAGARDIKRALFNTDGKPDTRLGGTVKVIEYSGKQMGFRKEGELMVLVIIEFGVTYVENVAAP
jgi:hypothetical protein